jgi:radical SAM protein with 4Fe4S-binding SPASM domain
MEIYNAPKSVDEITNLMILPNHTCNFCCSYCYSAHSRANVKISLDKLKAGIRYFFNPDRLPDKHLSISVLGGGEPLLEWNILKEALEYAYEANAPRGTKLPVSIVTNGSIINDEILSFCRRHNIKMSISFDILKDIQNKQRSQYDIVCENINRCANYNVDVAVYAVITNDNITRMEEMIETAHNTIPNVKRISFRPIAAIKYFLDNETMKHYYRVFIDNFFNAKLLAKKYGISLTCSYQNVSDYILDRYCSGKFVITPEGAISICHYVSSGDDDLREKFFFGHIDDTGNVIIDHNKAKQILACNANTYKRCENCIACQHCAGGCYAENCFMSSEKHEIYCESMRYFLSLYQKINNVWK